MSASKPKHRADYVVCVDNSGYPASLERHKIYRTLPDDDSGSGDLRIVDESGEDYRFPTAAFEAISPPERVRASLWRSASP